MSLPYILKIATNEDIPGIIALHQANLVVNLNKTEKQGGFVTTALTVAQIEYVIQEKGLFVAQKNNTIIGFMVAADWIFFEQWPIFKHMIDLFPKLSYKNFSITTENNFQYGPVCIDRNFRGQGILQELFEFMRLHMLLKFPLSLTFINKTNIPSFKAHTEKLRWKVIDEFQFNANEYYVLAYDMQEKKVPNEASSEE
jgi:hypothetical protein